MKREPVNFKTTTKIKELADIKVGKYYYFYSDLYMYCGGISDYPNAYIFKSLVGTHFIDKETIEELAKNGGIYRCKILAD